MKKVILFFILQSIVILVFSQYKISKQVVCSAGDIVAANNLDVDFTVGEITAKTVKTTNYIVTHGFVAPSNNTTNVKINKVEKNQSVVYPNPCQSEINVKMQDNNIKAITVYDITGNAVIQKQFNGFINQYLLNVDFLSNGIYFVTIVNANLKKEVVKIIKNK